MSVSVFDMFSIGIGPSSSHTVGPMKAARLFAEKLEASEHRAATVRVCSELFGSLGATGPGHGSGRAVLLGLEGEDPATVDTKWAADRVAEIRRTRKLRLLGLQELTLDWRRDVVFNRSDSLPGHPNGMRFSAFDDSGEVLLSREYFSVGGGFVLDEGAMAKDRIVEDSTPLPLPFATGAELLDVCQREGLSVSEVMYRNEEAWHPEAEIDTGLLELWGAMKECIEAGCKASGELPGGLRLKRRARDLHAQLTAEGANPADPLAALSWLNLWAMAVNEENAAGGRVVTAPTNGAAGIIPSVLAYYLRFCEGADDEGVKRFLLAAGAVGVIFMINASISGAEVGCQGEVGVACSMAAAGLTEALGGTPGQVENAAEIGMEHNLGLTCDPVGGLVQVPCIERNAMGAVKAVNASRLALAGDGSHAVSLDEVVVTMRETGADMQTKYKETSRGGLAVNVIEC